MDSWANEYQKGCDIGETLEDDYRLVSEEACQEEKQTCPHSTVLFSSLHMDKGSQSRELINFRKTDLNHDDSSKPDSACPPSLLVQLHINMMEQDGGGVKLKSVRAEELQYFCMQIKPVIASYKETFPPVFIKIKYCS